MDRAEREIPKWGELALAFLKRYAERNAEFPGFFVTMAAETDPNFPAPAEDRAWGGVWKRAARMGIVKDTSRTMRHPRRHGVKATVWRSMVYIGSTA